MPQDHVGKVEFVPNVQWDDARKLRIAQRIAELTEQRDELLAAVKDAREALQFANDSPGGGISDTIWMMHRPETLFDFLDEAIAKAEKNAS